MEKKITCLLPFSSRDASGPTIKSLESTGLVPDIRQSENITSGETLKKLADSVTTDYILVYTKQFTLDPGSHALERLMQVCESTGAGMVYSDYYQNKEGVLSAHPVIDYQEGSLRDDFDFGSLMLYRTA